MDTFAGFPVAEVRQLPHAHVGRRLVVLESVDSTNTRLLALVGDPTAEGLALLADTQTGGRGQHGRSWQAAARSSVLLSVLVRPPELLNRAALLTAWSAVAVCELVRECGLEPTIKWPNDILLAGRKVCGILSEQSTRGEERGCVVGIGLNVWQSAADFQAAGLPAGTSLALAGGQAADTRELACRLLGHLDRLFAALVRGDITEVEHGWRVGLALEGRIVVAECAEGAVAGRLLSVGLRELQLETLTGERICLVPESVRHLTAA